MLHNLASLSVAARLTCHPIHCGYGHNQSLLSWSVHGTLETSYKRFLSKTIDYRLSMSSQVYTSSKLLGLAPLALGFQLQQLMRRLPPTGTSGAPLGNGSGTSSSLPRSTYSSNIGPNDTKSNIAPTLPERNFGHNANAQQLLTASRLPRATGRTDTAQECWNKRRDIFSAARWCSRKPIIQAKIEPLS